MVTAACCGATPSSLPTRAREIHHGAHAPTKREQPRQGVVDGRSAHRTGFLPIQTVLACNGTGIYSRWPVVMDKGVIRGQRPVFGESVLERHKCCHSRFGFCRCARRLAHRRRRGAARILVSGSRSPNDSVVRFRRAGSGAFYLSLHRNRRTALPRPKER